MVGFYDLELKLYDFEFATKLHIFCDITLLREYLFSIYIMTCSRFKVV